MQASPRPGSGPPRRTTAGNCSFRNGTAIMAVAVQSKGHAIDFGPERELFDASMAWEYDVAPGGDCYSLAPVPGPATQTHIQLRTRWFDEVDRPMRGAQQSR